MSGYCHILAAVDMTQEARQVVAEAASQAKQQGAKLSVMTVLRPINYGLAGLDIGWGSSEVTRYEEDAKKQVEAQLAHLVEDTAGADTTTFVCLGSPAQMIKEQAQKRAADLIVMGTHSRTGFDLLLGSTATGVLHGACCSVLAVKIAPEATD